MSDYVRNVVVRMPLPNNVLERFDEDFDENYSELEERLEKILGYDVTYQTPGTIHLEICYNDEKSKSIPYLDYIIEHYYGEDSGDYGFVLLMHSSEKELYSNIFKTLFKQLSWEFDISKMVKLTFCYYNGVDLPDYYPEEIEINNDVVTRKFEFVKKVYDEPEKYEITKLPERSTKNSMAYDIYSPIDFEVKPKETYMLKTGIKAQMGENEGLILNVRSSMGKKHIMLANINGWIDSDYYNNTDNEGEIGVLFYNYGEEKWEVKAGDRIAQCMFINFLTVDNDNTTTTREGGWGSTNG